MERSLIWIEGDANGWACSHCSWRFSVPTLLSGDEAMAAYDRLAGAKFRDHNCEAADSAPGGKPPTKEEAAVAERCQALIKRGYKPKVAVELVLQEMQIEHGHDPKYMDKARAATADFLLKVGKGLI